LSLVLRLFDKPAGQDQTGRMASAFCQRAVGEQLDSGIAAFDVLRGESGNLARIPRGHP
jgi:hypothetical protein